MLISFCAEANPFSWRRKGVVFLVFIFWLSKKSGRILIKSRGLELFFGKQDGRHFGVYFARGGQLFLREAFSVFFETFLFRCRGDETLRFIDYYFFRSGLVLRSWLLWFVRNYACFRWCYLPFRQTALCDSLFFLLGLCEEYCVTVFFWYETKSGCADRESRVKKIKYRFEHFFTNACKLEIRFYRIFAENFRVNFFYSFFDSWIEYFFIYVI